MSFQTINNTTPFFEGTDTHALMGNSSYSTTGTTSFSAIHTDVAGQEYVPFGAPATTSGPRRIGRDEFLEDIGGSGAIGEDKFVPVGDASHATLILFYRPILLLYSSCAISSICELQRSSRSTSPTVSINMG